MFRRGSRDLGPGREGPSSLLVTWGGGRWVILLFCSPAPILSPPLSLVPLVAAGWRLWEGGPTRRASGCCTFHSQVGLGH